MDKNIYHCSIKNKEYRKKLQGHSDSITTLTKNIEYNWLIRYTIN